LTCYCNMLATTGRPQLVRRERDGAFARNALPPSGDVQVKEPFRVTSCALGDQVVRPCSKCRRTTAVAAILLILQGKRLKLRRVVFPGAVQSARRHRRDDRTTQSNESDAPADRPTSGGLGIR
jgi:hypothetical protein